MSTESQSLCTSGSNSIAIELLRTGTPHNQTLSPGITYLALCGAHPPAEFRISLEQYKFSRYLLLLRYKEGTSDSNSVQLAKEALQEIITKIFEDIPALQTEATMNDGWLHLRLIMSPRELAMLPFEMALTPTGFQGARDKPFLLNPQRLTTITREIRQVSPKKYNWPVKPRILFIWADPAKDVPHAEHFEKLKQAVVPWTCPDKNKPQPEENYAPLITELPHVTFSSIRLAVEKAANEKNFYTHIHILAHGIQLPDIENGPHYALALHMDDPNPKASQPSADTDAVDGARLADVLMVVGEGNTYIPAVVTIAACDGGNEGTNLLPGGSLGHILHQSGVPYVLASQFPLSIPGSIKLVENFYPKLLQGEDPRSALYFTRQLLLGNPKVHDWASLVAYARFPDDFEDQLDDIRLKIAFDMMKAANSWTDHLVLNKITDANSYTKVETRLDDAIGKLKKLLPQDPSSYKNKPRLAEHLGLLGSAYKRLAEHLFRQGKQTENNSQELLKRSGKELDTARNYYRNGHDSMLAHHWTSVQFLSLTAILKGSLEKEYNRWCVTRFAAENDLANAKGQDRAWALGTLAELYLLKPFAETSDQPENEKNNSAQTGIEYLEKLADSEFNFAKESTAKQLDRYINWWPEAFPSLLSEQLRERAILMRKSLPELEN